jgi:hypothetical protein
MKTLYLKSVFLLAAFAMHLSLHSQAFTWFNKAGTDGSGVYSDGTHVYRIGYFNTTTTAGSSTLTSNGNYDILITKSDLDGNVIWAKNYGAANEERGSGLCVDPTGNIYITGYFTGTTTIGANTYTNGATWSEDSYVAKLDASGNMLWSMLLGNDSYCRGLSVSCDATGSNVYLLGTFSNTLTIGATTFTQQGFLSNNYVVKLTPAGTVVWAKNYGSGEGKKLKIDATGNGYFLCNYFGSTTVGTNTLSSGGSLVPGAFVAKFDPSGSILSAVNFRGCLLFSFCIDGLSNIWATGKINSSTTIGTFSLNTNGNDDILVVKASSTGSITLAKNYGAASSEFGGAICADASNDIYVAGNKANTNAIGTLSAAGGAFFVKLDNSGVEQKLETISGTVLGDQANDLHSDSNGNVFATGIFYASSSQPIAVNTTTYTQGGGFLTRLNSGGGTSGITENGKESSLSVYPNPAVDLLTISQHGHGSATGFLQILDYSGKVVSEREINALSTGIDVSGLRQGIYLVRFKSPDLMYTGKFIKQ